MDESIKNWIEKESLVVKAENEANKALSNAENAPLPKKLRKVESKDIVLGNIIWYPEIKDFRDCFWMRVEEVLNPDCEFKAFCAQDGSKYGLEGAFIEE